MMDYPGISHYTYEGPDDRKEMNKTLEQNRRDNLRGGFEELKTVLMEPRLTQRINQETLLKSAYEFIVQNQSDDNMHSMASIDATSQRDRLKRLFDEDRELDRKIESLQKERHRLSIEANQSEQQEDSENASSDPGKELSPGLHPSLHSNPTLHSGPYYCNPTFKDFSNVPGFADTRSSYPTAPY